MRAGALLVLLVAPALVSASLSGSSQQAHQGRKLLQSAFCPDGCMDGFCQQAGTPGALMCAKCQGTLLVDKATGMCACPRGTYSSGSTTCLPCPKGSYCTGGIFSLANPPRNVSCPAEMTTAGMRSTSSRACVNQPGYSYSIDSLSMPSVAKCPVNTYGPGLKKQRLCVPCPTGFTTNGKDGQINAATCVVPAGWYLKTPGVAAPCPRGEYKSGVGADGACTKCVAGVTTFTEASTSAKECKSVTAGFYASSFDVDQSVNGTTICPQGFYCPGGNQTQVVVASSGRRLAQTSLQTSTGIIQCPNGAWTKERGAQTEAECLTPPGFFTNFTSGTTQRCPEHSYRANWLPPAQAQSCTVCGVGVKAERTDRIVQMFPNGTDVDIAVTSSTDDCYIQTGQGLYYETLTQTWRAKDCTTNNYGVDNSTFGLQAAPCKDCPSGMVASTSLSTSAQHYTVNTDGTGGFDDEMACVTKPGFGMTGRGAQKCAAGFYNAGNNYDSCTACQFGFTTAGAGLGITAADCVTDLGYGISKGRMGQCPIGTYGDEKIKNATIACKSCPYGRTTSAPGSDSITDCQLCLPGFGGMNCTGKCGGSLENATYGPSGREMLFGQPTPCLACSAGGRTVTYSFSWNMQNDPFTPKTVARIGAASPIECLSEYSQINDGTFYLPLASSEGVTIVPNILNFTDCTAECDKRQCQLVTYDYVSKECIVRTSEAPVYEGMPWLALKVLPSGYVGTSPWSTQDGEGRAKSLSTGMYTFYQEKEALSVGIQDPNVPGRSTFTSVRDCLQACDDAGSSCAGVTLLSTVEPVDIGKTCAFVRSNNNNGEFKRTMIRADLNRLIFPSPFLCPSGYTQDGDGIAPCEAVTTPAVVQLFLRANSPGGCTADLISSVRTSLMSFLQDPNSAFGVYGPGVFVTVGCFEVPFGQGGRRLKQTDADPRQVDLFATITMSGPVTAGQQLLETCKTTTQCTAGTVAVVTGGDVIAGTIDDVKPAEVKLVATPNVLGEPYFFTSTYLVDGQPKDASVFLTTSPGEVLACRSSAAGTGVTTFECNPLKEVTTVTVTANGPTGDLNVNTVVTASVTVTNTTCLKGSIEGANGVCTPCERGTWAAAGGSSCTACDTGFTTRNRFSFNSTQCTLCQAGRETATCTECVEGKFRAGVATASASLVCGSCPTGQTTEGTGQTACALCVAGYAGASCGACPKGEYSVGETAKDASVSCALCPAGKTTVGTNSTLAGDCNTCLAGYAGTDCAACPIGQWAAEATAAGGTCTPCAEGLTTAQNTSTSVAACSVCKPGYGGQSCTACPIGTFSLGGPRGSAQCTPCGAGLTTAANTSTAATACAVCLPGFGGESCTACAKGSWSAGGTEDTAKPACTGCTTGSTTSGTGSTASTACNVCTAGYGGVVSGTCSLCPVGTSRSGEALATVNCTTCAGTTTTLTEGQATCNDCVAGRGGATCALCPVNTYNDGTLAARANCTACSTNKIAPAGSIAEAACVCPTGTEGTNCNTCARGYFSPAAVDAETLATCSACPANTTTPVAATMQEDIATACTMCVAGHGGPDCDPCPAGSWNGGSVLGRDVCTACQSGSTVDGATGSTSIDACTSG